MKIFGQSYKFFGVPSGERSAWSVFRSMEGLTFLSSVVITAVITIIVTMKNINLSLSGKLVILNAFALVSIISWIALTICLLENKVHRFYKTAGTLFVLIGPIGLMVLLSRTPIVEVLFYLNTILWCAVTIYFLLKDDEQTMSWDKILLILSVIWAVSGAMITIGSLPWFPFSVQASKRVRAISIMMDLRIMLLAIFLIFTTGTAVYRALLQKKPPLNGLQRWGLSPPGPSDFISSALAPVIQVINVLLLVGHAITEFFWKALQLLFVCFGRIGSNLGHIFKGIFFQFPTWILTGRSLLTLLSIVVVFRLLQNTVPTLYSYLSTCLWSEQIIHLSILFLKSAGICILVWIIIGLVENKNLKVVGDETIMALGWVLMVYLLSGVLVYCFHYIGVPIDGYEKIGLFSILLVSLIALGLFRTLFAKPLEYKKNA